MKQTRVGVVGVGSLGQHHARIYAELEEAELVGVVDIREDRRKEIAERYQCAAFGDFADLIGKVDAISLAVPTESHAAIGASMLEEGIHVLVEKPICSTLEEADQLIAAAEKGSTLLQVGQTERFNPVVSAVLSLVKAPGFFEAHRLGVFVPRSLDIDVVLDLMIHDLDLVLYLVGERVRDIRAVGIPVLTPRVDIANVRLEFESGCVANLTASRVSREKVRKLRMFQAHDYISIDFSGQNVEVFSLQSDGAQKKIIEKSPEVAHAEPLKRELTAFLESIEGQASSLCCTGREGKQALELALKILGQMHTRTEE